MKRWAPLGALLAATTVLSAPVAAETVYFASDNVEYIATVDLPGQSAGARRFGNHFYAITSTGLYIFDVGRSEDPQLVGSLELEIDPHHLAPEDLETNGEVLLVRGALAGGSPLLVVDVRNPSSPRLIDTVPGAGDHTTSCLFRCRYAYGSSGSLLDLTDPDDARVSGNWATGLPAGSVHDVTEVRPGILVTASDPVLVLDARADPAAPRVVAEGRPPADRYMHQAVWPRGGKDRFLIAGSEKEWTGVCTDTRGTVMTFEAAGSSFKLLDEYGTDDVIPTDGGWPAGTGCGHWFDVHPGFRNGGSIAAGWYEHGVRFLSVSRTGIIEELGYFVPVGGSTSAAYWIDDEIVYATDYNDRGFDILRFSP